MPLEERLQALANSLEMGVGKMLLRAFLFVCLVFALFGCYAFSRFQGLTEPGAMEQAQLARNLAAGRGFRTECVYPSDLWYLTRRGETNLPALPCPEVRHAPLYPAVLALGFKVARPSFAVASPPAVFPPEARVIVPVAVLFSVATGLLMFLMGRRLFDARTGFFSMVIYFLTDAVLADSISGTAVPMVAFLTAAASYAALIAALGKARSDRGLAWVPPYLISAAICGLAFLTGYAMVVLAPVLAFFLASRLERWRWTAAFVFLLVFTAVALPWLLRNRQVGGDWLGEAPYAALNQTALYADNAFDRSIEPDVNAFRVARAAKAKFRSGLLSLYEHNVSALGSGLIVCFFLVSLFSRFEREEANRFRWPILLALLLLMGVSSVAGGDSARLLHAFLPFVVLYGTAFLLAVLERTHFLEAGLPAALPWVIVALTALPAVVKMTMLPPPSPYPPCFPPFIAYVSDLLGPGEALCTDIPWATAWYGDRPSILLPRSVGGFLDIEARGQKIGGIYLTTETGNKPYIDGLVSGGDRSWLPLLNRRISPDFPFAQGIDFPPGTRDQLFLTDRIRWPDPKPRGLAEEGGLEIQATAGEIR